MLGDLDWKPPEKNTFGMSQVEGGPQVMVV